MIFRIVLLVMLCLHISVSSQIFSGTVYSVENQPVTNVLVINIRTKVKSYTDQKGAFFINAVNGDEIRFVREGYERTSKTVKTADYGVPVNVLLVRSVQEIEEVRISQRATGNLKTDTNNFGDSKSVALLKAETSAYIRAPSAPEIIAPKAGEFVQPVGKGFFIGGPVNRWNDTDLMEFLIGQIGEGFFTDELQLHKSEIQPYIFYVFRDFERKQILFKGECGSYDLSRFIRECYSKLELYRKNLPNQSGSAKGSSYLDTGKK